jgi:PAS domain S-box-containing protein
MDLHLDAQSWQTLTVFLGQAAGVLTACAVIWKFIGKPTLEGIKKLREALFFIERELRPNGGGSLRDAANRIEQKVNVANRNIGLIGQRQLAMYNLDAVGIWETDANGLCTYVNPAMARLAGAAPGEFMGLGWKTLVHPDDREELSAAWKSAVADKRDFEFHYRFVNGAPVRISGKRMFGPGGEVPGWIGDCHRRRESDEA